MAAPQKLASFFSQSAEFETHRAEIYPPLDISQRGFRLMTLHPGKVDDQLRITLEKASLDENPPYEAISYTWEDLSQTRAVDFNGYEYVITKNQFEAVQHFRHESVTRLLWMDVFCIDQVNLTEKNYQVSMMGEIYAGATTTLIWLGQFNEDWVGTVDSTQLEKAADLLKDNPNLPRVPGDENHLASSPHLSEFNYAANGENGPLIGAIYALLMLAGDHHLLQMPVYSVDDEGNACPNPEWYKAIETLRLILNRPWWQRAWVLQEVAWSKQPPMVHMGSFQVPLKTFCNAAAGLTKHVLNPESCCVNSFQAWSLRPVADTQAIITTVPRLYAFHAVREVFKIGQVPFEEAVSMASKAKVTDPRDCIYSLLSLVPKDQRVHVDYSYTVAKIYTLASWSSLRLANSLNGIEQGGTKRGSNDWHLPSWVRDWSKTPDYNRPFPDWVYNRKIYTVPPDWDRTIFDASNGSLTVPYVVYDTVEACFPASVSSHNWRFKVLTSVWLQQLQESGYSFELTTFMRTVFRNIGVNSRSPFKPGDIEDLAGFYRQCSEPGRSVDPEPPGFTLHALQYAFVISIRQSCLFVTKQKRLGIGHEGIKPGDLICHVRGCCVPVAIREVGASRLSSLENATGDVKSFWLVDACYLDGGMDLETTNVDWSNAGDIKLV